MRRYLSLFGLLWLPVAARAAAGVADAAGEDPGLFVVMMVVLGAFLFMLVSGLLILVIVLGILSVLGAVGILSLSVLAGWYHRSFSRGLSTFFRLCFVAAGSIAGLLLSFVVRALDILPASFGWLWLIMMAAGAVAGWLWAALVQRMLRRLLDKLR